jgi:hypothetical protein
MQPCHHSEESEIVRLRRELQRTRMLLAEFAPVRPGVHLFGYLSCPTRDESNRWEANTIEELIASATPIPTPEGFPECAMCPLCGKGPRDFYGHGFTLPEGLRRHLSGWGHVKQCPILDGVMGLAREHWDEKFRESERRTTEERNAELAARRKVQTLYRISPNGEAELATADIFGDVRNAAGIAWAEERLEALGFHVQIDNRIKSYTKDHCEFVVYADPRTEGTIKFSVFKGTRQRGRIRHSAWQPTPSFNIPDRWKHGLSEKYEKQVADALSRLGGASKRAKPVAF